MTAEDEAYLRAMGNPYAKLSLFMEETDEEASNVDVVPSSDCPRLQKPRASTALHDAN